MIIEHDIVVLSMDIPEHGLTKGDVGAVVHCYDEQKGFEVEFVTAGGTTIAVLTLTKENIRPIHAQEILHARELSASI